jgi:predicted GTPase
MLSETSGRLPQTYTSIIVTGTTGNGKTTTINTLFGSKVGEIGHYARGTNIDEVYEWESSSELIHIVDLPGLGDSPKNDLAFLEIYSQRAKQADGVIVVVCPPRPAAEGTLKTIRLLLSCGISSRSIIFGFNKISQLYYESNDGNLKPITVNGLAGVTILEEIEIIEKAKTIFLSTLRAEFPSHEFSEKQVVEYDSISGWNLYKLLIAIADMLPYTTIRKLRRVANNAYEELRQREIEKIRVQKQIVERENARRRRAQEKQRRLMEMIEEERRDLEKRRRRLSRQSTQIRNQIKEQQKLFGEEKQKIEASEKKRLLEEKQWRLA